ncbi:putative acyltransferase YihG [compost metagenome]
MGRYTRKQIMKNPELGRRDMEVTRKACEKFNSIPVAVMNFVEGTRFTQEKHDGQNSPFKYLLKPKSGGVAFVLDAMGKGLHALLDVTIVYPKGIPSMIDLMANRLPEVKVLVRKLPIPAELVGGNYQDDRTYRAQFQQWMNSLWVQKDAEIAAMLEGKA